MDCCVSSCGISLVMTLFFIFPSVDTCTLSRQTPAHIFARAAKTLTQVRKARSRDSPTIISALHSSPLHSSPLHSSPLHSSPLHSSPLHSSPLHSSLFTSSLFTSSLFTSSLFIHPSLYHVSSAHNDILTSQPHTNCSLPRSHCRLYASHRSHHFNLHNAIRAC
jgi:hypothetical protein